MNLRLTILLLIIFASCNRSVDISDEKAKHMAMENLIGENYHVYGADRFTFLDFEFVGDSAVTVVSYDNVTTYATGAYAVTSDGDTSELKIGEWVEYHPNGEIRSAGKYGVGKYIQCCAGGPCMMYYDYKYGYWQSYYSDGKIKSRGNYQLYPSNIQTSCEGGAIYLDSKMGENWESYDSIGNRIEVKEVEVCRD